MWEIRVPLYYTGLADVVKATEMDRSVATCQLGREYCIGLSVTFTAHAHTWFVIE